uniref:Uncharacterized protein n=1 Tax=viral metagenome TaxID=1070528 RepID=A0A6C0LPT4_9ZZZZ
MSAASKVTSQRRNSESLESSRFRVESSVQVIERTREVLKKSQNEKLPSIIEESKVLLLTHDVDGLTVAAKAIVHEKNLMVEFKNFVDSHDKPP